MPDIAQGLSRMFALLDGAQKRLTEHWQQGANRRTIIIILVAGAMSLYSYATFIEPPGAFPVGKLVSIPEGTTLQESAEILEEHHVIRSALAFRVLVTLTGHEHDVHAGDYMFKEPRPLFTVARAIVVGQFGLEPVRIRIHEGATTMEMSEIFAARLERFNSDSFVAQAKQMEGFLFPDTYYFLPNATEDVVIKTMRQNFDDQLAVLEPRLASSTHSLDEIIIMASILEREGNGRDDDRRHIAGILWNRIEQGMPLQVDAVFLYTIGRSTFSLTKADLASDSPYNTYRVKGLPPTPIGSPSLDSIEAALDPIPSKNIFYLADRYGNTYYSRTYAEHMRKKAQYVDTVR